MGSSVILRWQSAYKLTEIVWVIFKKRRQVSWPGRTYVTFLPLKIIILFWQAMCLIYERWCLGVVDEYWTSRESGSHIKPIQFFIIFIYGSLIRGTQTCMGVLMLAPLKAHLPEQQVFILLPLYDIMIYLHKSALLVPVYFCSVVFFVFVFM